MRGDAAGQAEDGLEPVDLGVGVAGDLFPAIGAAGDVDMDMKMISSKLGWIRPCSRRGVRRLGEGVEERGRVVEGRRGRGIEADGHGADVPDEVV